MCDNDKVTATSLAQVIYRVYSLKAGSEKLALITVPMAEVRESCKRQAGQAFMSAVHQKVLKMCETNGVPKPVWRVLNDALNIAGGKQVDASGITSVFGEQGLLNYSTSQIKTELFTATAVVLTDVQAETSEAVAENTQTQ